jgi:hypothetical protein
MQSILNTPLFAGFSGFVSKLWLMHDVNGRYRGLYEWDGPVQAEQYARSLWRVLKLVSERGSSTTGSYPARGVTTCSRTRTSSTITHERSRNRGGA